MGEGEYCYSEREYRKQKCEQLVIWADSFDWNYRGLKEYCKKVICNMHSDGNGDGLSSIENDAQHHANEKSRQKLSKAEAEKREYKGWKDGGYKRASLVVLLDEYATEDNSLEYRGNDTKC